MARHWRDTVLTSTHGWLRFRDTVLRCITRREFAGTINVLTLTRAGAVLRRGIASISDARPPSTRFGTVRLLRVGGITDLGSVENVCKTELAGISRCRTGLSSNDEYLLSASSQTMAGSRRWRRAHVLESVPSFGGDPESSQITKIFAFLCPTTKDVHDIAHQCGSVSLSSCWDEPDTIETGPCVSVGIVLPDIVVPVHAVCTTKQQQFVVPGDDGMICSGRRYRIF